jgi:Tfp pilus assembly protein PilO|tara:strand:+ start:886 stop:1260 length:375 start_codon:yes stop_codon:yes gene_type:complete
MARLYIFLFVLAILAGIGYGAYFIYNDTMQRMATLRDNNAKLEVAVKAKDSTIKALQENMQKQIKLTKDLNNKLTIAEENNKKISNLLAKTDIIKNSLADPIGQEKRINEQVNKMFGGINAATK